MGLSNFQRGSLGQDVSALGNLGAFRQGITQAQLQQMQTMLLEQVLMNLWEDLDQYGAGLGRLAGFGGVHLLLPMGGGVDPLLQHYQYSCWYLLVSLVNYTVVTNETIK